MGLLNFRTRSKILGLPIGPTETDWSKVARVGAASLPPLAACKLLGR